MLAPILALAAVSAAPAPAGPSELRIEHAAARVVVIPEARADVAVTVRAGKSGPAPTMRRDGKFLVVDGGVAGAGQGGLFDFSDGSRCKTAPADLPLITVRAPLNARITASGAIQGQVGPSRSLVLNTTGCSHWTAAAVNGLLAVSVKGPGAVTVAGNANRAELSVDGPGSINHTGEIGELDATTIHNGKIRAHVVYGEAESQGDVVYGRPAGGHYCTLCQ